MSNPTAARPNDPPGTFRLATALVTGAYHGPAYNPGTGCLPAERGANEPSWQYLRDKLVEGMGSWRFQGTAAQAKLQAPAALTALLGNGYSLNTSAAAYRAIIDPITDEVIGHDYGGWVYQNNNPVLARYPDGSTVYATVYLCTMRIP